MILVLQSWDWGCRGIKKVVQNRTVSKQQRQHSNQAY